MYDDYPLSMHDFSLHDPFMLADRRTGLYYLYNANYFQYRSAEHGFGKSVVLYTSPDLKHFSEPVSVFDGRVRAGRRHSRRPVRARSSTIADHPDRDHGVGRHTGR